MPPSLLGGYSLHKMTVCAILTIVRAYIDKPPVENYYTAPRGRLTTRYHGYIIGDKSNEGQDASWRIEMGNPKLNSRSDKAIMIQPQCETKGQESPG